MTEEEAIGWIDAEFGSEALVRLKRFADLVIEENQRQNLISPATIPIIWSRHIADSLQLVPLALDDGSAWLDIGTGGGFPGLAIAIVRRGPMLLVEPRRRRVEFLRNAAAELGCIHVEIFDGKIEKAHSIADTISARAVAPVENLLRAAGHCATTTTRWLLPRGSIDREELAALAQRRRMMFHVEQSLTQPESSIVILEAQ